MATIHEIMGLWPSAAALAEDLGELPDTVRKWKSRGRIPADKLEAVRKAAQSRAKSAETKAQAALFRKVTADALIQACSN